MKPTYSPRALYLGGWALAGLYNMLREAFYAPWGELIVFNAAFFTLWPILGLATLALVKRYPLAWDWKPLLLHAVCGIIITQADVTFGTWIAFHILGVGQELTFVEVAQTAFKDCFHIALLHYFCFLGILQSVKIYRQSQASQLQIAEHKTALVRAQLHSLKTQLQPHFLFNTLNSIASLMHYDVNTADRMLNRLSELLRISLKETGNPVVSLKQEMDFILAYLEIEKIRFEERLDVAWAIPENLKHSAIPPFILQPLVENAIKYGIAPRADGGSIIIRAYTDDNSLLLEVEDDAPPLPNHQPGFGIGLSNTKSRLETLYGANQGVELLRAGLGTIARIRMPLFLHSEQPA